MAKTNKKVTEERRFAEDSVDERLAGGFGGRGAKQSPEALLRRAVMSALLWEDIAYQTGQEVAENIRNLIPQVNPQKVAEIAFDARHVQKLRHVPLYIASVMAGLYTHKAWVSELLKRIVVRADELAEFVAIYWKVNGGRRPLSAQVKRGLAGAFGKFNEYQFAKYRGDRNEVKLRDVMKLVHPVPADESRAELYGRIKNNTLETPDTWEVELSRGGDKKESWTRLVKEGKLGALAFLRNLRNMEDAGVSPAVIRSAFSKVDPKWLVPLNFFSAVKYAPRFTLDIENLMLRMFDNVKKLPGYTIFVLDVSGSMKFSHLSTRSEMTYYDAGVAMAIVASNMCENFSLYATAGSDSAYKHATAFVNPARGFALAENIAKVSHRIGNGGIFTRQALEYIHEQEGDVVPERIIVFSDSQDCDRIMKLPKPFGKRNYIVDISSHSRGINYEGVWTAEISGWSESFIEYIMAMEGQNLLEDEG